MEITTDVGWTIAGLLVVNALVLVASLLGGSGRSRELERALREEVRAAREESAHAARELRDEVAIRHREQAVTLVGTLRELGHGQSERLDAVGRELHALTHSNEQQLERLREALSEVVRRLGVAQAERLDGVAREIRELTVANEQRIERLREAVEGRLGQLQASNEKKLDEMRRTVDEQLQGTLEKRLGDSFRLVSERLEAVHKGLGEMQQLAAGVGDLKRVLGNVKTRGTWGEVQLGALLEQVLTEGQYGRNVRPRPGAAETVEFAVRLPGPDDDPDTVVWLPIDAKFPQEDYQRLVEASEAGDADAVQRAVADLSRTLEVAAREIRDKYVEPPHTTDFAIMFLPTEGLYAEVARQPGLLERLQRECRVVPAGPTTLAALLNSLQMGFRTLAIEKRSSEVWKILSAVKSEFGKFGDVLGRVRRQLDSARNTIDRTGVRTRAIERRLREVEELPAGERTGDLLRLPGELDELGEPEEPVVQAVPDR